jgi:hypothetical protein
MFSQVVTTLLRLIDTHADRWREVRGSHDVPIYGFERVLDPPPLNVDTSRLLEEFVKGRLNVGDEWQATLARQNMDVIAALLADADSAHERRAFNFPDETWARVVYDVAVAYHERLMPIEKLVASLIPLYFARVASLIFETQDMSTDQAELVVERQAHVFELMKPYLLERWQGKPAPVAPVPALTRGHAG